MSFDQGYVDKVKALNVVTDEFLKAQESGKPFHVEVLDTDGHWMAIEHPSFQVECQYRIVYKPAEIWACRHSDGQFGTVFSWRPFPVAVGCTLVKFVEET